MPDLLDLNKIVDPQQVVLDGVTYTLKPVSAKVYRKYQSFESLPASEKAVAMYEIVKVLLPDVDEGKVDELHPLQIAAVIEMAMDPVKAADTYARARVDARAPNAEGDESLRPSSPTIGLDTSVIGSQPPPDERSLPFSKTHSPSPSTVMPS